MATTSRTRLRHTAWSLLGTLVVLLAAAPGTLAAAVPAQAAPAPVLVVHDQGTTGAVVFDVTGIGPGYRESFPFHVRNDARSDVAVTFTGLTYLDDGDPHTGRLEEHTTLTLTRGGINLTSRGAADGATFTVAPGSTVRLDSELSLDATIGNEAQADVLKVRYEFDVSTEPAPVATGGAGGVASSSSGTGQAAAPAGPDKPVDLLPRTGESIGLFHALVWLSLALVALALLLWLVVVLQRRREEEPVPVRADRTDTDRRRP